MIRTSIVVALFFIAARADNQIPPSGPLPFSCATFPPGLSESDLQTKFGKDHVKSADVPWGGAEGDRTPGTVLFDGVADLMVQIHWRDAAGKRLPDWVDISGLPTRWRTPAGITVGTDLRTIERMNGRPFRLNAFGSDIGGGLISWDGGRLASLDTVDCRIGFRFREDSGSKMPPEFAQISRGDRNVSSGHPAMQSVNPTVWEMAISYARAPLARDR